MRNSRALWGTDSDLSSFMVHDTPPQIDSYQILINANLNQSPLSQVEDRHEYCLVQHFYIKQSTVDSHSQGQGPVYLLDKSDFQTETGSLSD